MNALRNQSGDAVPCAALPCRRVRRYGLAPVIGIGHDVGLLAGVAIPAGLVDGTTDRQGTQTHQAHGRAG